MNENVLLEILLGKTNGSAPESKGKKVLLVCKLHLQSPKENIIRSPKKRTERKHKLSLEPISTVSRTYDVRPFFWILQKPKKQACIQHIAPGKAGCILPRATGMSLGQALRRKEKEKRNRSKGG